MTIKRTRREALIALGGLGAGAVALQAARAGAIFAGEPALAATTCTLAPEVTEGKAGIPLSLHLTVVDATTCKPIKGADVEIWHADAQGVYSGVQGNTGRFLRGHQRSDANGRVVFHTIYPGWYRGRTPHIHLKVHVGGSVVHTGQVFFRDATSDAVYRTSTYRSHGQADTTNARDNIYAQAGGSHALLKLTKRSSGKGYVGAITLGVKR